MNIPSATELNRIADAQHDGPSQMTAMNMENYLVYSLYDAAIHGYRSLLASTEPMASFIMDHKPELMIRGFDVNDALIDGKFRKAVISWQK